MRSSLQRLKIVALVAFFPLAVLGMIREKTSLKTALRLYYISIFIFCIFMMLLALYTFTRGGNFIKPLGTFY
ncbi:MAG: hypothetical protein JWO03_940 [Bacteroidetes bacterium]|nr:hypothetical protein [Bacteroidota bacterium]